MIYDCLVFAQVNYPTLLSRSCGSGEGRVGRPHFRGRLSASPIAFASRASRRRLPTVTQSLYQRHSLGLSQSYPDISNHLPVCRKLTHAFPTNRYDRVGRESATWTRVFTRLQWLVSTSQLAHYFIIPSNSKRTVWYLFG